MSLPANDTTLICCLATRRTALPCVTPLPLHFCATAAYRAWRKRAFATAAPILRRDDIPLPDSRSRDQCVFTRFRDVDIIIDALMILTRT